eukprot:scaffold297723_cov19-Tisochrysis_lutea.AAC.1
MPHFVACSITPALSSLAGVQSLLGLLMAKMMWPCQCTTALRLSSCKMFAASAGLALAHFACIYRQCYGASIPAMDGPDLYHQGVCRSYSEPGMKCSALRKRMLCLCVQGALRDGCLVCEH